MAKILILNGSPRKNGKTASLVNAFKTGAESSGNEVKELYLQGMKINGCLGCGYCHGKGEGNCIQKDDLEKIMPAYNEADMIVFASPIYYFTMTAQMQAAIQRMYCIWKPRKAQKTRKLALLQMVEPDFLVQEETL